MNQRIKAYCLIALIVILAIIVICLAAHRHRATISNLNSQIATVKQTNQKLVQQIHQANVQTLPACKATVITLQNQIAQMNTENNSLKTSNQQISAMHDDVNTDLTALKQQNTQLQNSINELKNSTIMHIKALNAKIQQLEQAPAPTTPAQ
tara:strand:- start:38389 stop:38841 length:453 start_codon:yes stop_codon:yes gene_type:complete